MSLEEPNAFINISDNEEDCDVIDCDDVLDIENTESESDLSNVKIEGKTWINKDIVPVKKIKCIIPLSLLKAIKDIENCVNRKFSNSNEFSIYIRGEMNDDGVLEVFEDYYIPKQRVTAASVDYLEEPNSYYNGCLHKHPDGCMNFSGVDEKYINSNFEFSLLYVKKKIHLGIINIKYMGNRRVQVPLDVQLESELYNDDIDIDNITMFVQPAPVVTPNLFTPHGVVQPQVVNPDKPAIQEMLDFEDQEEFLKYLGV